MKRILLFLGITLALCSASCVSSFLPSIPSAFEKQPDSVIIPLADGFLKLEPRSENTLHVQFARDRAFFRHASFAVEPSSASPPLWTIKNSPNQITFATAQLQARVDLPTGRVSFYDAQGKLLSRELPSRLVEPAEVQGQKTSHIQRQWQPDPNESLYGLGQHQYGLVNLKGYDIELWQHNTEIAVPFLLSSKGYGIFWDNPSYTKFGDPRSFESVPAANLIDATGKPGGLTATIFSDTALKTQTAQRVDAAIDIGGGTGGGAATRNARAEQGVRWEGQVLATNPGVYKFQLYANGGTKMWIDDQLLIDHWRQNWLAWNELAVASFAANTTHKIKIEWSKDQGTTIKLTWKPPLSDAPAPTSLWSEVGNGIDYYFIAGGPNQSLDHVMAGYRDLTGKALMMPIWAFGLWQSRQRYETQQASLDVVKGFRDRKIPFDNIVQDWMYWRQDDWGSHNFDPQRFPNPDQWVKDIHALDARVMISVWGKFYPTTDSYKALNDNGFMYPIYPTRDWVGRGFQYAFYDAFNPAARQMFWQQVNNRLFTKGFDAWWMDATEPDIVQPSPPILEKHQQSMAKTAAGPSSAVMNAYPALNSQAVYEGQRKAAPDQRVFILTRSGYAGQQKFAAASWSGDITSSWTAMKKQIAAGLGYSISGLPYWTMDAGGFSVPAKWSTRNPTPENLDEWRELNTRWFEFATFVPLLRVHGESPFREMWQFGGDTSDAFKAQLKFDQLRYRLLPYLYSLAGSVTQNNSTFMRPLVMDFPTDPIARDLNDQYLFGPAILVSPVTTYQARSRPVYLPAGNWYDFWTGQSLKGNQTITAAAPFDAIPLHIRAGSILPFGPDLQYTTEKKPDPITLYIYSGTDADFTLYEDDGLTYAYEKGQFTRIPIHWNEKTKTLTIDTREGSFPAMLTDRTFNVVLVTPQSPTPFSFSPKPQRTIYYHGNRIETKITQ